MYINYYISKGKELRTSLFVYNICNNITVEEMSLSIKKEFYFLCKITVSYLWMKVNFLWCQNTLKPCLSLTMC